MNRKLIAQVAHEVNRAYCLSIGDDSQPAWADAPDWRRESCRAGVQAHLDHPDLTPSQSHELWMAHREAEGWVYGIEKDPEAKTHPCMVAYEDLPQELRSKDYIFKAVVEALKGIA
jgi:hypothetical protein